MRISVVMTVLGLDRPGLVDLLSSTIARHDGNWLQSHMSHLGGHFAGILRVEVPSEQEAGLADSLQQLSSQGVTVVFHTDALPAQSPTAGATLELVGHDRPGIIRQISAALACHNVNVEELVTGCDSAPMTGEVLFRARILIRIPESCDLDSLRLELERIAADLMVDLRLNTTATSPA